jgi:hypothetical protein
VQLLKNFPTFYGTRTFIIVFTRALITETHKHIKLGVSSLFIFCLFMYCGVAPRGRSIERPLLINGHAYLAVSLLYNGQVDSNSYATEITDRCLGNRSTNRRPARGNGTIKRVEPTTEQLNVVSPMQ